MRIVVATAVLGRTAEQQAAYERSMAGNLRNHQEYCNRHGYTYVCARSMEECGTTGDMVRPFSWHKIPLVQKLSNTYDWVLWIDADARFLKDAPALDGFIDRMKHTHHLVLMALSDVDMVHLQMGVFLVRGGGADGSRRDAFMAQIWEQTQYINDPWWEQRAVNELFKKSPEFAAQIHVLPSKHIGPEFQCFPGHNDHQGKLIVHYAGAFRKFQPKD